jgi:hypothetical protein
MQLIAIDSDSGQEKRFEFFDRIATFQLEQDRVSGPQAKTYNLRITYDGKNVIVTNCGLPNPVQLADLPLPHQVPVVWLAGQELRIAKWVLFWEVTHLDGVYFAPQTPLEQLSPWFFALLLLLLCVGGALILGLLLQRQRLMQPPVLLLPTSTTTSTATPIQQLFLSPVSLKEWMPTPTLVTDVNQLDLRPTVTPTPTATITGSLAGGQERVCKPMFIEPRNWSAPLDSQLDELGILIQPACVFPGRQYYHLLAVEWLDVQEAQGTHHVYVDVVDQHEQRIVTTPISITMSWETGSCIRELDSRPSEEYGANCPMYAAGPAYKVRVNGLPSDIVHNIGLGGPKELRELGLLTSFKLRFQLRTAN